MIFDFWKHLCSSKLCCVHLCWRMFVADVFRLVRVHLCWRMLAHVFRLGVFGLSCAGSTCGFCSRCAAGPGAGGLQEQVQAECRLWCWRSSGSGADRTRAQVHTESKLRCRQSAGPGAGGAQAPVQVECSWVAGAHGNVEVTTQKRACG